MGQQLAALPCGKENACDPRIYTIVKEEFRTKRVRLEAQLAELFARAAVFEGTPGSSSSTRGPCAALGCRAQALVGLKLVACRR